MQGKLRTLVLGISAIFLMGNMGLTAASVGQAETEDREFVRIYDQDGTMVEDVTTSETSMDLLEFAKKCTYDSACTKCKGDCKDFCDGCLDKAYACGATKDGTCACGCSCKTCPSDVGRLVTTIEAS